MRDVFVSFNATRDIIQLCRRLTYQQSVTFLTLTHTLIAHRPHKKLSGQVAGPGQQAIHTSRAPNNSFVCMKVPEAAGKKQSPELTHHLLHTPRRLRAKAPHPYSTQNLGMFSLD